MNQDLIRFASAVRQMRYAQQQYFRQRSPENLQAAKAHEQHVDDCIAWIDAAAEAINASDMPLVRKPN